jgi:hypothetical protein
MASAETQITGGTDFCRSPDVTWTGSQIALAWHDDRNGDYDIYFQRFNPDLTEVASVVRVTDAPSYSSWYPAIAWSGSRFGLAWRDHRLGNHDVYFATLESDGTRVGTNAVLTDTSGWGHSPDIVWASSKWAVSWQDDRHGYLWEIYLGFVDASGSPIGSGVRATFDPADSTLPSLAWSGSEIGIHWADSRAADWCSFFALHDADGAKEGSDLQLTPSGADTNAQSIDWSGSAFGLTWYDDRTDYEGIYHDQVALCD